MAETIEQIYIANPATELQNDDLMYLGRSPYGATNDMAIKAQSIFPSSVATAGNLAAYSDLTGKQLIDSLVNFAGGFSFTGTMTGNTNVTFPTSGTLATTSQLPGFPLGLSFGGTNANLTAATGGIVYSSSTALAILAPAATANLPLLSGSNAAPTWSPFPLALAGSLTTSGAYPLTFTLTGSTNVTLPTTGMLVNKAYVDSTALISTSVYAATTGALTVTQAGAGAGATLTNAGSQATFSLDSVNPVVGDNVLIKNQSTNTQNGIYTVTNVGSNSTNWVLTRSTSYDTPEDINDTGIIVVTNGTLLTGTQWYNTTYPMVTVDTTAITYSQTGVGTVTSVSVVTANNFSGTVATATSTPAITIGANTSEFFVGTGGHSDVTGDGTSYQIVFETGTYNPSTMINLSTGTVTVPATGMYSLSGCIGLTGVTTSVTSYQIEFNGTNIFYCGQVPASSSGTVIIPFCQTIYLTATSTPALTLIASGTTKTVSISSTSTFGMALIR